MRTGPGLGAPIATAGSGSAWSLAARVGRSGRVAGYERCRHAPTETRRLRDPKPIQLHGPGCGDQPCSAANSLRSIPQPCCRSVTVRPIPTKGLASASGCDKLRLSGRIVQLLGEEDAGRGLGSRALAGHGRRPLLARALAPRSSPHRRDLAESPMTAAQEWLSDGQLQGHRRRERRARRGLHQLRNVGGAHPQASPGSPST